MKTLNLLLMFFIIISIHSKENETIYKTRFDNVIINADEIKYWQTVEFTWEDIPNEIVLKNYTLDVVSGVPFYIGDNGKKLMILKNNDMALLYSDIDSNFIFWGFNEDINLLKYSNYEEDALIMSEEITSTSALKEGHNYYSPVNLDSFELEKSWVEGVKGYGIGEKLMFSSVLTNGLYFFNGFVSFENPQLFKENSRVKKIKVKDLLTNEEFIFDIEDTPNPQLLDLKEYKHWNLEIEIIDIYEGTKYKDTCINSIGFKNF